MKRLTPRLATPLIGFVVFCTWMGVLSLSAQVGKYDAFFEEAYQKHPTVPRGVLEAVAYTNTRMRHVTPAPSCQELPTYYGVMGLVENGKGYFKNSLLTVAELSGYDVALIKRDPRINILAYASAYSVLQANKRMSNQRVETHQPIMEALSEIPEDGDLSNDYALDQQFYGVLDEMQNPHGIIRSRRLFNYEQIFGRENYRVLSADRVTVEQTKVRSLEGDSFDSNNRTTCTASGKKPDYTGALFVAANSRNYGSRGDAEIKYVTIHTIQGSYASAIAWFKNRNARVSAHYIIRASDGQITQMVCESDKAFHVKTDNAEAIGIEHEGFIDDGLAWYTNEMYESSAALVRDICKRYKLDPRKTFAGPPTTGIRTLSNICYLVKGHQHFRGNNHIDPGPFWDWERYYRLINGEPTPEVFTDRKGRIYDSGGKNGDYAELDRRAYLIQPKNATTLTLTFEKLDLEGTNKAPFDYLTIYEGNNSAGKVLGRFTGAALPPPIKVATGAAYIEFRSDCQVNKGGWELRYTSDNEELDCPSPQNLVASQIFPMGATLSWNEIPAARQYLIYIKRRSFQEQPILFRTTEPRLVATGLAANAEYQWQVRAICATGDTSAIAGETFQTPNTARNGRTQIFAVRVNQGRFFDSGGAEGSYGDREKFLYQIIPPDGGRVELVFRQFATEQDLDKLTIYDGTNLSTAANLGTFSGTKAPSGTIMSSGNGLSILFESDQRTIAAGWRAYWRSVDGGDTPPPTRPDPAPPTPTPDPVTPPVVSALKPVLQFPRTAPTTEAQLAERYDGSFTLSFKDKDNSGRGMANRFYNVAQQGSAGLQSNSGAGFFYDDFSSGLRSFWTQGAGNWEVNQGILVQKNLTLANTNLYADLTQRSDQVYVYHWKARMSGGNSNLRHGLHFFASKPALPDRGTSYLVWIREGGEGASLEKSRAIS